MNKQQHIDRRITRTKIAIRDALVFLIQKKGFDNLSVSEIAACGKHQSRHFLSALQGQI